MKQLRPYQKVAIQHIWEAFDSDEKIILAAATGAGKTLLAATLFVQAREKGLRVAFCVPFLSLIDQTFDAFVEAGLEENDISLVQADNPLCNYAKPIQICSVDTLVRRKNLPEVDVVIFDEVHRNTALYKRWFKEAPHVKFAGVSATPWTRGMKEVWDRLIIVATTRELITQGYLCDYKYYAPSSPDLSGVSIVAGDYHEGQLSDVMKRAELVADVVKTWKEQGENRPTLAFCVSRDHAREVQSQFLEAGVVCEYIDAYTEIPERKNILKRLESGDTQIVVNIACLTTGLDAPFVSCIILARPTKSASLFVQILGRGLRTHPSKEYTKILDHSDTGLNLGLPCSIHHDDLVSGKSDKQSRREAAAKEKKPVKPHKCVACNHLHDISLMVCPSCGNVRKKFSDVLVREGYLTELSRDGSQVAKLNGDRDIRQDWYSGLLYICMEKGWSQGAAAHKFKEKFGVWPDGLRKVPKAPSLALRSWIRSRNIAYAKAKAKSESTFRPFRSDVPF